MRSMTSDNVLDLGYSVLVAASDSSFSSMI